MYLLSQAYSVDAWEVLHWSPERLAVNETVMLKALDAAQKQMAPKSDKEMIVPAFDAFQLALVQCWRPRG